MCGCSGPSGGADTRRNERAGSSPPASRRCAVNRLADDADSARPGSGARTTAIEDYELAMIRRSAANMRAIGLGSNSEGN